MRVSTPQIAFHVGEHGKNDPIYTVNGHPQENVVATGGSDNDIKVRNSLYG